MTKELGILHTFAFQPCPNVDPEKCYMAHQSRILGVVKLTGNLRKEAYISGSRRRVHFTQKVVVTAGGSEGRPAIDEQFRDILFPQ
jgi:hypothetical protein